jgi:hypothetical protein
MHPILFAAIVTLLAATITSSLFIAYRLDRTTRREAAPKSGE